MTAQLQTLAYQAAEFIKKQSLSTRIRVVSHYDADGISAAAIICHMLRREGYDFHVILMRNPFTQGLERIKKEQPSFLIFTDMGSGQLSILETFSCPILIIDHHQVIKKKTAEHILQVNANLCGINGNYEASGASIAYSVACAFNENNTDLASFALAGATGDKQYIGGFRGYNELIINDALKNNAVTSSVGIKLSGSTLVESLLYAIEPFYQGISGRKEAIQSILSSIGIADHQRYEDLNDTQRKDLHSILILRLIEAGCTSTILETAIRKRYYSDATHGEMERFADLLDSCGKGGQRDIGLALCLGDDTAYEQAIDQEHSFKQTILSDLLLLEKDGVNETTSFRYFYSDHSSLGGVVGGIATNFLLDESKPLISIVKKPHELHISGRGNRTLVAQGLDLGAAMEHVAKQLDGHGGGHKIAAGATLPAEEESFLKELDSILLRQMKKEKEAS